MLRDGRSTLGARAVDRVQHCPPKPEKQRHATEPRRRMGGDQPATRLDAREDATPAGDRRGQVIRAGGRPARRRRRSCSSRCARGSAPRDSRPESKPREQHAGDRRDRDCSRHDSRGHDRALLPLASLSAGGRCQKPNTSDVTMTARRRVPARNMTPSSTPRKMVSSKTTVPSWDDDEWLEHSFGRRVLRHVVVVEVGPRTRNRDQHDDRRRDDQCGHATDTNPRAQVGAASPSSPHERPTNRRAHPTKPTSIAILEQCLRVRRCQPSRDDVGRRDGCNQTHDRSGRDPANRDDATTNTSAGLLSRLATTSAHARTAQPLSLPSKPSWS